MNGGIVLIREGRSPDVLDIRDLVASALQAFCEEYSLAGAKDRKWVLQQFAEQAREMRAEIR